MKSWTAPGPGMIYSSWLKELTGLHQRQATQINQLPTADCHLDWQTQSRTTLIIRRPPQGNTTIKLLTYNLYNMETPVRRRSQQVDWTRVKT